MPYTNPFSSQGASHPGLSEWQRQALMALPYVGPAYGLARGVGALYRGIGSLFHPGPQLPVNSETNNPPMYAGQTGMDTAGLLELWRSGGGMPINSETNNPPMYAGAGQPSPMYGGGGYVTPSPYHGMLGTSAYGFGNSTLGGEWQNASQILFGNTGFGHPGPGNAFPNYRPVMQI